MNVLCVFMFEIRDPWEECAFFHHEFKGEMVEERKIDDVEI